MDEAKSSSVQKLSVSVFVFSFFLLLLFFFFFLLLLLCVCVCVKERVEKTEKRLGRKDPEIYEITM